jgi:predicted 3-demethylubiquinone-9 3-methyltransferase (glyoxalase superfamily)
MTSITPFLWFDNNVPEAVAFYKSVFPNAKVETVNDFMATFELEGRGSTRSMAAQNTSSTRRSPSSSASRARKRWTTSGTD